MMIDFLMDILGGIVSGARGQAARTKPSWTLLLAGLCVFTASAVLIVLAFQLTGMLSSDQWCNTALGADAGVRSTNLDAARACVELLTIQLKAIALNSVIAIGVLALCLLALVVIVIAEGRLRISAGTDGAAADIGLSRADTDG